MKKRIFSIVTAVLMMCTVICYVSPVKTHAASQADALVDIAKSQLGVKERSSGSDDIKYNDWYYGRRVSNSYSGQYAWCAAFVSWCANQAGIPQSIIPKTAGTTNMKDLLIRQGGTAHLRTSGYHPVHGDIIFFGANAGTHVGIVDYTSGNTIYYIDGNNTQTNPHGVHYSSRTFSRTDVWGFVTPNYSGSSSPSARPTNPTIQTSQYWFDLQDTIEVTAHADGATSYFMSFYKDNHLLYQQGVSGGTFRIPASRHGQGKYSAYFSCSNGAGTVDTKWIDFSVVGAPAYSDVHVSKSIYGINDTVELWVDSICSKYSVIGIDNNTMGKRIITERTSNDHFRIAAKSLGYGRYSAYFSVANGSGSIDTKRVYFEITKPAKPTRPTAQTSQYWYDLKDTIEVTVHADGATNYYMSMFKDDKPIYQQGVNSGKFRLPASKHGKGRYSAYFSCSNSGGTIDTEWINFEVVGAPAYKGVHVSKSIYDLSDTVEIWVDSVCAKSSVISVFNSATGKKLLTEKTSNDKFKISAKRLGYGTYSAYFTVVNGSGSTDTKWINFEIAQPVSQIKPAKPANPVMSNNQNWYDLNETIKLSAHADGADSYYMSVFKDDKQIYGQKVSDGAFSFNASKYGVGKYSAYCSCTNSSGTVDTKWINFSVVGIPMCKEFTVSKVKYSLSDIIELSVDASYAKTVTLVVSDTSTGKRVLTKTIKGSNTTVPAKDLGAGSYQAYLTLTNGSGSTETGRAAFDVVKQSSEKATQNITGASQFEKTIDDVPFSLGAKAKGRLTYQSGNTKVVTVSSSGFVTIKGVGTADIIIKAAETDQYQSASKTVTIIVKDRPQNSDDSNGSMDDMGNDNDGDNDNDDEDLVLDEGLAIVGPSAFRKVYGAEPFYLNAAVSGSGKLYYETENSQVVHVDNNGLVTLNGTGKTWIVVTAVNEETGRETVKKVAITIVPERASITRVSALKNGKLKVVWGRDTKATGYQVVAARNSKFTTGKKTALISRSSTTSKTFTGLKKKANYYIKVRGYKQTNGTRLYGAYSRIVRMKVR